MMRTSNTRVRKLSLVAGKIMMALVFASVIGGICSAPVFARDNDRGRGRYDRDRYDHRGHGHHRGHRPPYNYYQAPVYAPPPVVYAPVPYQSPGISLVFPIHIR